jgi:hypothetical protein
MKSITYTSVIALLILLIGCGSSEAKKVDNFLDDYENVVVKWEKAIEDGEFDEDDADEMNKTIETMEQDAQELRKVTKWSKDQQQRYADLSERIMDAVFKSIQYQGGFSF